MNKEKNTKTQQETSEEDREKLLVPKTDGDDDAPSAGDQVRASRKKKIIWGIVIAVIIIGIVLAIVLPLTLSKKDDDNKPNPPIRPDIQEYNPYVVEEKDIVKTESKVSGLINLKPDAPTKSTFGDKDIASGIDVRTAAMFGDD